MKIGRGVDPRKCAKADRLRATLYGNLPTGLSEVPSVATIIVGAFAAVIIGAAGAFAYIVFLSDDKTPTGP